MVGSNEVVGYNKVRRNGVDYVSIAFTISQQQLYPWLTSSDEVLWLSSA